MTETVEPVVNMSKQECAICVNTVAVSKIVKCPYCEFDACIECYKYVMLDSINPPACMNVECKKQFSDDFVYSTFPKTWLEKTYRAHVTKTLVEKEKALLPETQPHVERILLIENMKAEVDELSDIIQKMLDKRRDLLLNLRILERGEEKVEDTGDKKLVMCACSNEECRGYVYSDGKCGICESIVCKDCHRIKKDEHECKPDDVASVKELSKSTRKCPNCMVSIFKTEGCDQMWCTKCNTAFNWKTGKVEKGIVHNPHYFEYLRQNGGVPRNPHEVQCGGMPDVRNLNNARLSIAIPTTVRYKVQHKSARDLVTAIYRNTQHIRHYVMPRLPTVIDNSSNLDLRIKYLRNKLTDEKFASSIYLKEKDRKKKLEYRGVLDTYCNVSQDLFTKLFTDFKVTEFLDAEYRVATFVAESIERINKKYKSKLSIEVF